MAPQGAGPGPICIECGGSGGSWRKIIFSKLDVTDPEHVVFECAHVLSEVISSGCNESNVFSNLGMALSVDESRLFVANPDQDTVEALDIATNTLLAAIPVGAGKRPVDVVVAKKGSPSGPERVYVANQIGQSITVIDLSGATPQVVGDVFLPGEQTPVALTALSNGTRLFTMNEENGTISVINLTLVNEAWTADIETSGSPARGVLLRLPQEQ